jgi:Icc-related predicted phosphoesterase
MRRVAWLTDVHLNFLGPEMLKALDDVVRGAEPDALLIGGDIDEAPGLTACLRGMAERLPCPVYFVLGNHDFYRGSIATVRREAADICREVPRLTYLTTLTAAQVVELTPRVGLVGHDGWADGRAGDYWSSDVFLNDYFLIEELAEPLTQEERLRRLNGLGDEAAEHVRRVLPSALERYSRVLVLTHVPPFREACWYQGRTSDDNWSPHFTCVAMGEAIREVAARYPHRQITVLCGHTHGAGEARIGDNIQVLTGGAEYGRPEIQRVFELE